MSGHTPGPWIRDMTYRRGTRERGIAIRPAGFYYWGKIKAVDEANAALIAAAPELLDLLLQAYDRFTDNDMEPANHALLTWRKATLAAIARAEGRTDPPKGGVSVEEAWQRS